METKLEYIYAVYQEKSFVKAAEKLYVSQPSLSITIKRIEQELGITIFDRRRKPLVLTEAGKAYIEYIEEMMTLENKLAERLYDIENLNAGQVRVGSTNYVLSTLLLPVLRAMRWEYPGVLVDLCEDNSPALRQKLLNGEIDILIDGCAVTDSSMESREILEENLLLVTPSRLGMRNEYRPYLLRPDVARSMDEKDWNYLPVEYAKEILREPILSFRQGSDLYNRITSLLNQYNVQTKILLEFEQVSSCIDYIEEGLGASLLPSTPFFYRHRRYDVCLFALKAEGIARRQKIIWRKGRYHPRAMDLFIEMTERCLKNEYNK